METVRKPLNEDRVALLLGSVIFILALLKFSGIDMLGWAVKIGMWVGDPLDAWRPATKGLLPGYGALFATYAILTGALACCVKLMGNDVVKFVKSFTIIFFIAMICYTLGANAYIAANPTQLKAQGIPWALGLSTEAGLILALVMGIVISNFMPNLAESLKDACRPELFVKIAIVIMGAELGVKAADAIFVKAGLDWDDGRYIYEIKMVSGTMEYECDINAATGVITDWDVDSIYD